MSISEKILMEKACLWCYDGRDAQTAYEAGSALLGCTAQHYRLCETVLDLLVDRKMARRILGRVRSWC